MIYIECMEKESSPEQVELLHNILLDLFEKFSEKISNMTIKLIHLIETTKKKIKFYQKLKKH